MWLVKQPNFIFDVLCNLACVPCVNNLWTTLQFTKIGFCKSFWSLSTSLLNIIVPSIIDSDALNCWLRLSDVISRMLTASSGVWWAGETQPMQNRWQLPLFFFRRFTKKKRAHMSWAECLCICWQYSVVHWSDFPWEIEQSLSILFVPNTFENLFI